MSFGRQVFGKGTREGYLPWSAVEEEALLDLCVGAHFAGRERREVIAGAQADFQMRPLRAIEARAYRLGDRIEAAIAARVAAGEVARPLARKMHPLALSDLDTAILQHRAEGLTRPQIGKLVGLTLRQVENRLSRLSRGGLVHLAKPVSVRADNWRRGEIELVQSLLLQGLSNESIGKRVTDYNNGFPERNKHAVARLLERLRGGLVVLEDLPQDRASVRPEDVMLRAPVRDVPRGLTLAQERLVATEHLDFVAGVDVFGAFAPRDDLRLCLHCWSGGDLAEIAPQMGHDRDQLRQRFRLICWPWAQGGPVPLGLPAVIVPLLRERAG
jgi:hypothetical protein